MALQEGTFRERIDPEDILKCAGKRVALDAETTGLRWWRDEIIGLGVWCPDANLYGYMPAYEKREQKRITALLHRLPANTTVIMHNVKFDLHFLGVDPNETGWKLLDTAIMVHLVDSRNAKKLDKASKKYLGDASKNSFKNKIPSKNKNKVWEWPIETVAEYCTNDSRLTYGLAEFLMPELRRLGMVGLFQKEMEYLKVLWKIERRGIQIDIPYLEAAYDELTIETGIAEKELWSAVGYEFNWRSPQQLSIALYDYLGFAKPENPFADEEGIDYSQFGERNQYNETATSAFLLVEKAQHPLGKLVLHLRGTEKLRKSIRNSQTNNGYLDLVDSNGALHANFNATGSRIGRLACSKPNLQNIVSKYRSYEMEEDYIDSTIRSDKYNLRKAFIAREGYKLVGIDYRQMEMRMLAILAQESTLLELFQRNGDIHKDMAVRVWKVDDALHRQWAKAIAYGLTYGMSIKKLAFKLNITIPEARILSEQYWTSFPRISPWLTKMQKECEHNKYVTYWSSRIWREENKKFTYKAPQAIISGGCADILSIATLRTNAIIERQNWDDHIVSLIHDEILFEIKDSQVQESIPVLADAMEVDDLFGYRFFTDTKIGPSYGELGKLA